MIAYSAQIKILKVQNLIASKYIIAAIANRETALGGWVSDHISQVADVDRQIDILIKELEEDAKPQ